MAGDPGIAIGLRRGVGAPGDPLGPPRYVGSYVAKDEFKFKQAFLTTGPDGRRKELVFALTVKDPAEANMAAMAKEAFLKELSDKGKVVSYVDIKKLKMTYPDGTVESIPEGNEHIKTLREIYARVARAREQAVSWVPEKSQSLASRSTRIDTVRNWPKTKVIERLGITTEEARKKRAEAIEQLRSGIKEDLGSMLTPPPSPENATRLGALMGQIDGTDLFALMASAAGVDIVVLEKAVRTEKGEKKDGIAGVFGRTNDELTGVEREYLEDIVALKKKDEKELLMERALLAAFDAALAGKNIRAVVEDFCGHPLVAASGLEGNNLNKFKEKLEARLAEMVRYVGSLPKGAHVPQSADLEID